MASESDTLKKDVEELRSALEKLTKDVSSVSKSLAEEMKARAGRTADDVAESARNVAGEISAKGRETAEAVEDTVRNRPFQSVMVAFGAGLLLAQLLRKR
mgnify:CR=1 FL=1|tara:strand:- start:2557 stop:2856 length:300 start_codon:yes stop_codon:yes gene_type:complete